MYYKRCVWLFVVLTISWLKHTNSTCTVSSNNNLLYDVPTKSCPSDGVPVCGERNQQFMLFPNDCLLKEVNKDLLLDNTSFKRVSLKYCLNGCQFVCFEKYRPICGQNIRTGKHQLFTNQCELMKYACQTSVEYNKVNLSECKKPRQLTDAKKYVETSKKIENGVPIPCTNILKPVCGIYMGVKSSFRNECLLNEENVKLNKDWRIVQNGVCAEDYSNTRQKKEKSLKSHLVKKRSIDSNFHYYHNEYDSKNSKDSKISSGVIPNNLYLYMPPSFQTQYLNYEANNYHQSLPLQKAYDEIYNKIIALPELHSEHEILKEKSEEQNKFKKFLYRENLVKPMPFRANEMNFNFVSDFSQSMSKANSQSIDSEINKFLSDTDSHHHAFKNPIYDVKNEGEKSTTSSLTGINFAYSTETSKIVSSTTVIPNTYKHLKVEKNHKKTKENECKFGLNAICGITANGTVQSFDTVCEMMSVNIYLKNKWEKLHDGVCESCDFNCSKEYKPICVTRNEVNYTMINDCYFNMGICMDKKSKWKKLTEGECERYTRIPDKYAYSKQEFFYTSDYFMSDTVSTTAINSLALATSSEKPSDLNALRIKERNSKRAINRHSSLCRCSLRSHFCNSLTSDNAKYRCGRIRTKNIPSKLALNGPQTESYIMHLAKKKANQ